MSGTNDISSELTIDELDMMTGGNSVSNAIDGIGKAIVASAASSEGPALVWVGCAWVPQWW